MVMLPSAIIFLPVATISRVLLPLKDFKLFFTAKSARFGKAGGCAMWIVTGKGCFYQIHFLIHETWEFCHELEEIWELLHHIYPI